MVVKSLLESNLVASFGDEDSPPNSSETFGPLSDSMFHTSKSSSSK